MSAETRLKLLRLYRETLKRCQHLGGERGTGARVDAQTWWRSLRKAGTDAEESLAAAESRVSYLRIVTPRYAGGRGAASGGGGSFVVREGALRASRGTSASSVSGVYQLPPARGELFERHTRLVDRQYFGGRRT